METFGTWWSGLTAINHWFYISAVFFSVFFLWQLVMAIIGLGGGEGDIDSHVEPAGEHQTPDDADQTVMAFKLLSVRSILAFFTLFSWAGAFYLGRNASVAASLGWAFLWGLGAMVIVSAVLHMLSKLAETGNIRIESTVGASGTVYLDIPAGGVGEVRVLCSGVMTHLKARAADGKAIKAGSPVRVAQVAGSNTVEVEIEDSGKKGA